MFSRLARPRTGLIVLTAALIGCDGPSDPYAVAELLLPKAAPRCTDAFGGDRLAGSATSSSVKSPAVAFIQEDYRQLAEKYRAGSPPLTPWRSEWFSQKGTISAAAVQTVICTRDIKIFVGIYQPVNAVAIREDWDVRVIRWPSGERLASRTFRGPDPPEQIKAKGSFYESGGTPHIEARRWLEELFQ